MDKHIDLGVTELGITVKTEKRAVIVELTGFIVELTGSAFGPGRQIQHVWQEFSPVSCHKIANALLEAASEAQGNGMMARAIIGSIDEDDGA